VVNGDQRFWGIPNLYAIDGSVFPTSGGYNPTLTIEALAWRTAKGIGATASFTVRPGSVARAGL
jgi:choline dehydrogenase-like flavoprotein